MPQRSRARRRAKKRARRRLKKWWWKERIRRVAKVMGEYIKERLTQESFTRKILPVISGGSNPPADHIMVAFDIETWRGEFNAKEEA